MQDVIYLLVIAAFFVAAGLFVVGCDKIIGPDNEALAEHGEQGEPAEDEAVVTK